MRGHDVPAFFLARKMSGEYKDLLAEVRYRVAKEGYELADFREGAGGRRVRLQVRIDLPGSRPGHGVTVADCARISRVLETWLDSSEILGRAYVLEVSSPGIERPIRWRNHWEQFVGHEVNVRLPERGRVRAQILSVASETVQLLPVGDERGVEVEISDSLNATLAVDW